MNRPTRTLRVTVATLAVATGLVTAAGSATAETTGTGSSSLGTGSADVMQNLLTSLACAVGAMSCPIVIPN
ncbi:hypothetical protein FOH10_20255 [Nocardia otitidiscaviarum]|uniref:DUF320 domain-containing protein n=1 Tax=Nocardia otitidiscaviarum TaxID=1823 RepID=A0A516NP70_9NOCA|nr:hypothetical protein [Nocardia otitidiscaviarum]MCP9624042.1 hypothetical protein [Nocardia otitidiscaviarum]QDP80696.1 hypothetical protein FOH10_20255 [Nocardia otitidiscaviarum]